MNELASYHSTLDLFHPVGDTVREHREKGRRVKCHPAGSKRDKTEDESSRESCIAI